MRIAFCQCTYWKDADNTLECVQVAAPYADRVIIVEDGSLPKEKRAAIEAVGPNVSVTTVEWHDSLPEFRNHYIRVANQEPVADWLVVSDPDEHLSELFWQKIRAEIEKFEAEGKNILGVRCLEQFVANDWYDDLDEAKEAPGKARESTFYKNLVFKNIRDLSYTGIGESKTVHETWQGSVPWSAGALPEDLTYTHRKSGLDVWRNAARNMLIGGGGDNVGELNEMWQPLVKIVRALDCKDWPAFEHYILEVKEVPTELVDWIRKALTFSASNFGTETRETAKWILWHHRELLDDAMMEGIRHPPVMTREDAAYLAVTRAYFEVLHRHPDGKGRDHYIAQILEGKVSEQQLKQILRSSPEYAEKFGVERVTFKIPVKLETEVSEELFMQAFMTSRIWWGRIKPRLDIGKALETGLEDKNKFYADFYELLRDKKATPAAIGALLLTHRKKEAAA